MKKVLVTAGPTRESIDAIRYISNIFTGRTGVEIAKEAYNRGYNVELIYGPGSAKIPDYLRVTNITTTSDLLREVLKKIKNTDIFISAAAVLDYSPRKVDRKIESGISELVIKLYPTPKIIHEARKLTRKETLFVTFKLDYKLPKEELIAQARSTKGDIIVANDLSNISENQHPALILYKDKIEKANTKREIAVKLFDIIEKYCIANHAYLKD